MSALCVQVADAVAASITAAALGVTAERTWISFGDLGEDTDPRCHVLPGRTEWTNRDRAAGTVDVVILIGVRRKLNDGPDTPDGQLDESVALCEQIAVTLRGQAQGPGLYVGIRHDPLWLPEHYELYQQFTGIIEVTYRCAP